MEHSDLDRVVEIWAEGNRSAHPFVPANYWESHLDFMREVLPQAEVWVYCIEERVVAFIGLDGEHIAGLFVAEECRSQGIGRELLSHIKSLYGTLSLCVYEQNPRAVAFYTREGFTATEHRLDPPTNAAEIVMRWSDLSVRQAQTSTPRITIRAAVVEDAELIATAVCMAVGYDRTHPIYPVFLKLAGREVAQYSYRNALVAEVDGTAAGALVGYDGARLVELREPIFALLAEHLDTPPKIEDETEAGEFYLDSLGVLPQFRGLGVGARLLTAMRDRAFAEGHQRVGLIVDFDNPRAEKLYASLRFRRVGEKMFLGHRMWHLQTVKQ